MEVTRGYCEREDCYKFRPCSEHQPPKTEAQSLDNDMPILLPPSLLQSFNLSCPIPASKQSGNINFMFRCVHTSETKQDDHGSEHTVFLRITPASFRPRKMIEGEIQWIEACVKAGLLVAKPLRSEGGGLSVEVELESLGPGKHTAVAFHSVGGRPANRPDDFTPSVICAWARTVASLHTSNLFYTSDAGRERPQWSEDRVLRTALADSNPQTAMFRQRIEQLMEWMKAVPQTGMYGLTHADLHIANFHILREDPAEIAVFDFDDSCYHWYVHDLAVAVCQLRKQGIDDEINGVAIRDLKGLEKLFLEEYFAVAQASSENKKVSNKGVVL